MTADSPNSAAVNFARASEVDGMRSEMRDITSALGSVAVDLAKTNTSVQSVVQAMDQQSKAVYAAIEQQGRILTDAIDKQGHQIEGVAERMNAPKNWIAGFIVASCGLAFTLYMAITSLHVQPLSDRIDAQGESIKNIQTDRFTSADGEKLAAQITHRIEINRENLREHERWQADELNARARWIGMMEERLEWTRKGMGQ